MKDISNSVDDKLKIYASSQKVNIPDSYNLMVENRVDRCLKENVPAKYKIHKTVAAAVVVAIVFILLFQVYLRWYILAICNSGQQIHGTMCQIFYAIAQKKLMQKIVSCSYQQWNISLVMRMKIQWNHTMV